MYLFYLKVLYHTAFLQNYFVPLHPLCKIRADIINYYLF